MEPCRTHCISFSSYRTRQQRDGVRGGRWGGGRWPLLNPCREAAILSHTPTERRASLAAAEACCAVAGTDGLPSREPEGLIARPREEGRAVCTVKWTNLYPQEGGGPDAQQRCCLCVCCATCKCHTRVKLSSDCVSVNWKMLKMWLTMSRVSCGVPELPVWRWVPPTTNRFETWFNHNFKTTLLRSLSLKWRTIYLNLFYCEAWLK